MTNLDERVRRELDDLANTVPASAHAAADFERELARGRGGRRMPVLAVAAAAAAVVAAVAIPVAMNGTEPNGNGRAGQSTSSVPPPSSAGPVITEVELGRFTDDQRVEQKVVLELWTDAGGQNYFVGHRPVVNPEQIGGNGVSGGVVDWPNPPGGHGPGGLGGKEWVEFTRVPWGGQVPNLLFVAAPNVVTMEVSDAAGVPVAVRQVAETETARYFFAKFPVTTQGYQYTAKDAAGNVVESGTT